ncbi:MAG: hypothetical protein C0601_06540 [Candidatus Muiribacterium halophilum]|uniref:histidine kinase n=1 Tax=Muiribacterium halophilum TaxID=2053465 RepID=A0A2N5ZGE0_MUIH1|nr:MAG: hypothetical protein C0601_06540 [Candidatus Muirbacterium halophilum]
MIDDSIRKVLLIDDENIIRRNMRFFLEDYEFQVFEAENGEIGLERFKENYPDIVLVDLRMPKKGGIEVIREIKSVSPETPVIVVSGTGVVKDAIEAVREGAWDYISKPVNDMNEVLLIIERNLDRKRLLSENKRYSENLEKLVKERTKELEKEITIRKKAEEAMKKAKEEAEAADRLKSEFLANMSHEIRTPMTSIVGFAELLEETELREDQRDYLRFIKRSSDHLLVLINDIMDLAKIETNQLQVKKEKIDVSRLVENIYSSFKPYFIEKELDFKLEADIGIELFTDKVRLRQIINNIVSNAHKFTSVGEVNLILKEEDEEIRITVSDTGIGIPEEKKDMIFKNFSQVDSSHTRKYGGAGLGLTISQRLANLLNGKIYFDSEYGQGSEFSIRFNKRNFEKEHVNGSYKG